MLFDNINMPEYQQWESWLAAYYFCPEKQGLDVVLYANKQIIVDIGRKNNVRDVVLDDDEIYHDFIDTVKLYNPAKISHYTPEQICLSAYHVYQKSRILVANHPPLFLAYLVLFVLADVISTDDRLHPNAYYERLRLLIGANGKGVLPDFYKMDELWKALERWSSAITKGSRGHTRLLTMTGHVHINYPRSQALLNSEDRDKLPDIFYEAGFEPGTPPEPGELGSVLLEYGKSVLHKRVIKLLYSGNDILKERFLELVSLEFEEWDGVSAATEETSEGVRVRRTRSNMRLSMAQTGNTISFSLRLYEDDRFPPDGFMFEFKGQKLSCKSSKPRWSTSLSIDGVTFNPTCFDLRMDQEFHDKANGYKARLKGRDIRVFVRGKSQALPDWIEVNSLETAIEFRLLVYEKVLAKVVEWGRHSGKWERILPKGVPDGWSLFCGENATDEITPPEGLVLEKNFTLSIEGGIKVDQKPATYLYLDKSSAFMPAIRTHNIPDSVSIYAVYGQNKALLELDATGAFVLSHEYPTDTVIRIEACSGDQVLKTKTLRFRTPCIAAHWDAVPKRGKNGEKLSDADVYASGSVLKNFTGVDIQDIPTSILNARIRRWTKSGKMYIIGNVAGQITTYVLQTEGWKPHAVWAVTDEDVCFLKDDFLKDVMPEISGVMSDDQLKRWKKCMIACKGKKVIPELDPARLLLEKFITLAEGIN